MTASFSNFTRRLSASSKFLRSQLAALRGRSPLSPRDLRLSFANMLLDAGAPIQTVSLDGIKLSVDLRDEGVGMRLYLDRVYEAAETVFMRTSLKSGMVLADIGANIGYFTIIGSKAVGKQGCVYAFEPDPRTFQILQSNIAQNRCKNVLAYPVALSDVCESTLLHRSPTNFGDHHCVLGRSEGRESISIECSRLDKILANLKRPDVLKLDIQGFELRALKGMEGFLKDEGPITLLVETWPAGLKAAGGSLEELLDFLYGLRFATFRLASEGYIYPISRRSIERLFEADSEVDPDGNYLNIVFRRSM